MSEQSINPLEHVRKTKGGKQLVSDWQALVEASSDHAVSLINDPDLEFPTLYLLKELLEETDMLEKLSPRNQMALSHIKNVLHGAELGVTEVKHFTDQHLDVLEVFQWILESGGQVLLHSDYSQVIDHTAIQLLLAFGHNCKKNVVDIIFYRHRHGLHRHYLTWAFYEACDARDLLLICPYFLSKVNKDRLLAHRLLNFIPNIQEADDTYAYYKSKHWLEENLAYLKVTDETNDMCPDPVPLRIHWCAKYLGIHVTKEGLGLTTLSSFEEKRWEEFNNLEEEEQQRLATHSYKLRISHFEAWLQWIRNPLRFQLLETKEDES